MLKYLEGIVMCTTNFHILQDDNIINIHMYVSVKKREKIL